MGGGGRRRLRGGGVLGRSTVSVVRDVIEGALEAGHRGAWQDSRGHGVRLAEAQIGRRRGMGFPRAPQLRAEGVSDLGSGGVRTRG